MSAHDLDSGLAAPSESVPDVERHQPARPESSLPAIPARDIDHVRARASLAALHKALATMETDIDRLAADGDLWALADGYAALDQFLRAARDVRNHAEDHIARLMPDKQVNLDDDITLERHGGWRWGNWDWDSILKEIGAHRWIDPDTGERVLSTLRGIVSLTKSTAPKAALWNEHGVDKDEVAEGWEARQTVQVRARKSD